MAIAEAGFLLERGQTDGQTHKLTDATESPHHATVIAVGVSNKSRMQLIAASPYTVH